MKNNFKRILTMSLAMVMVLGMVASAGTWDPSQGTVDVTHGVGNGLTITFAAGEHYDLLAKKNTIKLANGDVRVGNVEGKIDPRYVPTVQGDDEYYEHKGFYIIVNDEVKVIDIEEYVFIYDMVVYPIVEDTWPPYVDMNQDRLDWYYQYVRDLSIAGIVNGYPGYTFKPLGNVTWGEALKLIMRATGYEELAPTGAHWASGYLDKALEDGLVTEDQNIVLNDPITRIEYARVTRIAMKLPVSRINTPFADTDEEAVLALYEAGIIIGSFDKDGNRLFKPDDYINRAELCTVIWRINNYYAE